MCNWVYPHLVNYVCVFSYWKVWQCVVCECSIIKLNGTRKTSSRNQCYLMLALSSDKAHEDGVKPANTHLKEDRHGCNHTLLLYGCVETVEVIGVIHEDLHLWKWDRELELVYQTVVPASSQTKHTFSLLSKLISHIIPFLIRLVPSSSECAWAWPPHLSSLYVKPCPFSYHSDEVFGTRLRLINVTKSPRAETKGSAAP